MAEDIDEVEGPDELIEEELDEIVDDDDLIADDPLAIDDDDDDAVAVIEVEVEEDVPAGTAKLKPATAWTSPYRLTNRSTTIAAFTGLLTARGGRGFHHAGGSSAGDARFG